MESTTAITDPAEVLHAEVHKVGNLTDDPVLRRGEQRGTPWTTFGLALDAPVAAGDWSGERETRFYDCVCFDSLARNVAASLRKGDRAIVVGRLELTAYRADDGETRTRERLVAGAVGPELRWTTAKVTRKPERGTG
ncbi:MAG: single-stranded DNA-binding protein [Acidimicrobiia bacterium]